MLLRTAGPESLGQFTVAVPAVQLLPPPPPITSFDLGRHRHYSRLSSLSRRLRGYVTKSYEFMRFPGLEEVPRPQRYQPEVNPNLITFSAGRPGHTDELD